MAVLQVGAVDEITQGGNRIGCGCGLGRLCGLRAGLRCRLGPLQDSRALRLTSRSRSSFLLGCFTEQAISGERADLEPVAAALAADESGV